MKRFATLEQLIAQAQQRRDDALLSLAQVRRERQLATEQMGQLHSYTRDAEQRWQRRAALGVSPTLMATHRQFMFKLDDAIAYQTQVLAQIDERIRQQEAHLQTAERALATLQRLRERRLQQHLRQQQRLEQKAHDEMAAQQHRRHAHPLLPR